MDAETIAKGLSEAQKRAMISDRSRGDDSYSLRTSIGTMESLNRRGLVGRRPTVGSLFSPQTEIKWPLTPLGIAVRAILKGE